MRAELVRVVCGYCDGEQVVRLDGCGGECAAGNLCRACAEPCACVERVVMARGAAELDTDISF